MDMIWMGFDPCPTTTRVLALDEAAQPLLKARLRPAPSSRLALAAMCEAIALWQGRTVRAALVAAPSDGCSASPFDLASWSDFGNALYSLELVDRLRRPRRVDPIAGMGPFDDLRHLLLFEVAR